MLDGLMNPPAGPVPFPMTQPQLRVQRQPQVPLGDLRTVSLVPADAALAVALGVLLLGFALPQVCTVLQILMITGFILHGSAAWLPAIVALLFTPTDFKAGGMELQFEKFEGVTVYILGFPITASYAIVGAVLIRGLLELATMPRFLQRGFHGLWIIPISISASICIYAGLLALDARISGWSSSARATLVLVSIWYGVALTRDWSLAKDVIMRRLGPLCSLIVASGFFAPVIGILTCFYLPFAVAWAAAVGFGLGGREYYWLRLPAWAATAVILAVPVGGLRVSSEVAAASYHKMGNTNMTTMTAAMVIIAIGLAVVHGRVVSRKLWWLAGPLSALFYLLYLSLPFAVAQFSSGKEFDTEGNVGTLRERVTYKFFVERPAIWRGSIEILREPPYVVVSPGRSGSLITAGGQRSTFRYSAHNLVLDVLRTQGLVSGIISLTVIFICFAACVRCYLTIDDPAAGICAITFMVGGLVNGVGVGHLLETGPGFMLFVCAGVSMGVIARAKHLEAEMRQRRAPAH